MSIQKIKEFSNFESRTDFENIQEYIDFQEFDNFTKSAFKDVLEMASIRLEHIFPQEKSKDKMILIIALFLSKPLRNEIEQEKYELIKYLLETTKNADVENKDYYLSGKFSFMIVNLIQFLGFIMVYFLLSLKIFQIFSNLNKNEIENIFIEKKKFGDIDPNNLKEYFQAKLQLLNPKLTSDAVLNCCLPYIFDPIKYSKLN